MSSIYGKLIFNQKPITENDLVVLETPLNHWDADAKGLWCNNSIGLGQLMLYNTPESLHEKLPYYDNKSGLSITADARIDNREYLYPILDLNSVEEKQLPDSQLILKLYEKQGEDCVQNLIGDFAFAIWDEKEQKLFCARDQMGVKPFFYYQDNHFFAFASEKKGLLAIPELDKTIHTQFLYNQLFRMVDQSVDTTLYKHMMRIPPAHTLVVYPETKTTKLTQYWDLDAVTEIKFDTEQEYYDAFLAHFKTAVECRLRSAYPVATELSGGMDSSGITGVAARFLQAEGKELTTISNTIPNHITDEEILSKSEQKYINEVIKFNNIKQAITTISQPPNNPFEEIDFMLEVNDGLEMWQQQWQTPIRKSAKKEGIRTLLSGFPGDEMVTYRGKYYMLDYLDKKQYLKYFLAKKKFWGFNKLEPFIPYKIRYHLHLLKNRLGLYNKHIKPTKKIFNIPKKVILKKGDVNWLGYLKEQQYDSYRHYQKHRYLRNHVPARMESETRYGLYFRLEPRFPMADIRLTQFYLSMPNHLKYQGELNRTAYRKMLKDYLPQVILERDDKRGGMSPYFEPISDPEIIKEKQENHKLMMDNLLANLEGHPLLKHPIGKKGMNLAAFRWLEKNKDMKIDL